MNQNKVARHLLREISRATNYLLDRREKVRATLSLTHYRKPPLFYGGLEISCTVKVCLPASIKADLLIVQHKEIVERLYIEPKDEVIVGFF